MPVREDSAGDRAGGAARRLTERMAVLMHAIPCGVVIVDEDGVVDVVNDEFLIQFPLDGVDPAGGPDRALQERLACLALDAGDFLSRVTQLVGTDAVTTEDVLLRDGRVIERDYLPIRDGSGGGGWIWTYWDFTDRRRDAERELRRLRAEVAAREIGLLGQRDRVRTAEQEGRTLARTNEGLRRRDALRAQLLATASHELRTPLTSIMSFADVFAEQDVSEAERIEFAEVIQRNARRLLTLVDDLLLLTRLDSEAAPLRVVPTRLRAVVLAAVDEARARGRDSGADIRLEAGEDPVIDADPVRLAQVFDNLIGNAVKYGGAGGVVTVAISADGDAATVTVADQGEGIPPDEVDAVFERFFRASTARASTVPGTGLGLALVRSIVERHGGRVRLSSIVGTGTVVEVTLPRATGDEEEDDDG